MIGDDEQKFCAACCKPKPMTSFPVNTASPDGRLRHCFDCVRAPKVEALRPIKRRRELLDEVGLQGHRAKSPTGIGNVFEGPLVDGLASVIRQMGECGIGRRS
jgi:hypothetical protein